MCEPDPDTWFRKTFELEPEYSEVLDEIAKSPSERAQLLRGYFEPTEEERSDGKKQPTRAHRAIAELVSKGYIRVILTTNFDRLLEQALIDAGIQPTVISTPDAAFGALPLAHTQCTIVKVNGDYLDARLKNTRDELARYEEPTDRLLDQILDEYGVVICGWSGDWDTALRAAMERCKGFRFTTFWTARAGWCSLASRPVMHPSENRLRRSFSDTPSPLGRESGGTAGITSIIGESIPATPQVPYGVIYKASPSAITLPTW